MSIEYVLCVGRRRTQCLLSTEKKKKKKEINDIFIISIKIVVLGSVLFVDEPAASSPVAENNCFRRGLGSPYLNKVSDDMISACEHFQFIVVFAYFYIFSFSVYLFFKCLGNVLCSATRFF